MAESKKRGGKLRITQVRSANGRPRKHRATLEALGLRHQKSVVHDDTPSIRGMIFQVEHMVDVAELDDEE